MGSSSHCFETSCFSVDVDGYNRCKFCSDSVPFGKERRRDPLYEHIGSCTAFKENAKETGEGNAKGILSLIEDDEKLSKGHKVVVRMQKAFSQYYGEVS